MNEQYFGTEMSGRGKCNDTWDGYEIVGAIRESYIDGVWNKEDESEWLTEIQVPIKKITSEET